MRLLLMVYAVLVPFQLLASVFVWRVARGTPAVRAFKLLVIWLVPLVGMLACTVHTVLHLRGPDRPGVGSDSAIGYAGDSGATDGSGSSDSSCGDGGGGGDSGCS